MVPFGMVGVLVGWGLVNCTMKRGGAARPPLSISNLTNLIVWRHQYPDDKDDDVDLKIDLKVDAQ